MRIAVLTHNYPRFPGDFSGNFVAALSDELARQGNAVTVLAPWDAAYQPRPIPSPSAPHSALSTQHSAFRIPHSAAPPLALRPA